MISRSLNQDDFELFKEYHSSSSSSNGSEDEGNKDFNDDESEDNETLTEIMREEPEDFFDKIIENRRNTSV